MEMKSLRANAKNLQATAKDRDQLKKDNQNLKRLLEEANLKIDTAEASLLNKSPEESKEMTEMQQKNTTLQNELEEVQSQRDNESQRVLKAQTSNGELANELETLYEQVAKLMQDSHDKDLVLGRKNDQLQEAEKEIEQSKLSLEESQEKIGKVFQHEKELVEKLQISKKEYEKVLVELNVVKIKFDEQKDEISIDDQTPIDSVEQIGIEEYDRVCIENERLEQEIDTMMNKLVVLSQETASLQSLQKENVGSSNDNKILKENEILKNEISKLENMIVNAPKSKKETLGVFSDLREQNEEMQTQLQKSIDEIRLPNFHDDDILGDEADASHSSECSNGYLATIQESNVNGGPVSAQLRSLQDEIVNLTNKLKEYENNDQAAEILTLQDEVTCLNKEIVDLRGASNVEEVLTLQDEIQRLNKELATTKVSNGENDRYNAINTSKQFDQMGRLIDAVMEKDIEIRDLKIEIKAMNEKKLEIVTHSSPPMPILPLDDDDDRSVVTRLFGWQNKLPQPQSSGSDDMDYKIMYEQLIIVNESMRTNLENHKKESNLLKFKLKEEKERSAKDLEAFAESLHGVDELRTAAESMSRELKQRDAGVKNYSSGAQASFNASEVLDKLEYANNDMPLSRRNHAETDTWTGIIQTMRSIPGSQDNKKAKKTRERRKKRRGSGNGSVISSFF